MPQLTHRSGDLCCRGTHAREPMISGASDFMTDFRTGVEWRGPLPGATRHGCVRLFAAAAVKKHDEVSHPTAAVD